MDMAQDHVAQSTVLLQNNASALPIDSSKHGLNFLVMGNASVDQVLIGGGSGAVHTDRSLEPSPLDLLCDELGVPRIDKKDWLGRQCNKETGNCVQYFGYSDTTGGGPWEAPNPTG